MYTRTKYIHPEIEAQASVGNKLCHASLQINRQHGCNFTVIRKTHVTYTNVCLSPVY